MYSGRCIKGQDNLNCGASDAIVENTIEDVCATQRRCELAVQLGTHEVKILEANDTCRTDLRSFAHINYICVSGNSSIITRKWYFYRFSFTSCQLVYLCIYFSYIGRKVQQQRKRNRFNSIWRDSVDFYVQTWWNFDVYSMHVHRVSPTRPGNKLYTEQIWSLRPEQKQSGYFLW